MHDNELVAEVLRQIEEAADKIVTRFASVRQVSDLVGSAVGMTTEN